MQFLVLFWVLPTVPTTINEFSVENCFTIKQTALNQYQPLPTPYQRKTKFFAAMYSMLLTLRSSNKLCSFWVMF